MDNIPFEIVLVAIQVIVAVIVVGVMGLGLYYASRLTQIYQREADISSMMFEHSMFSRFDATRLSASDVIESIFTHASPDFFIRVDNFDFTSADFTLSHLLDGNVATGSPAIDLLRDFTANLYIGTNGEIRGIIFI